MQAPRTAGVLCLTIASLVGACSDETATGTEGVLSVQKAPTNNGNRQTDTVLATLAPFRVLVQRGMTPAQGVSVSWAPTGGGALPSETTTDASGIASQTLRFDREGTHTVQASVAGAVGSPVTFSATLNPSSNPHIRPGILHIPSGNNGNNQADTTNARLGSDYVVQVTDSQVYYSMAGVAIDWAVTAGGGSITPTSSTTQGNGLASARHTLGPTEGPQTVTATARGLAGAAQVTFTATAYSMGTLQLTTTTTGIDLPNGYQVRLSGVSRDTFAFVSANTTTAIRLRPGDYTVTLGGGAAVTVNCDRTTPGSLAVTVPSGGSAQAAFNITCAPAMVLAFERAFVNELGEISTTGEFYAIKSNGTEQTRLTSDPGWGIDPWSPDGTKVASLRGTTTCWQGGDGVGPGCTVDVDLYIMNADGSGATQLTSASGECGTFPCNGDSWSATYADPAWSPDGRWIAVTRTLCEYTFLGCWSIEVRLVRADGGLAGSWLVVDNGSRPAWRP